MNINKKPKKKRSKTAATSGASTATSKKKSSRARSSSPTKGETVTLASASTGGTKTVRDSFGYLNPVILSNVYYVSHGVGDSLGKFGIKWDGQKSKKKKKK